MKDDIHNTVLVDSSKDRAVLVSLGDVEKALQSKKGTKVHRTVCCCMVSANSLYNSIP